MEALASQFYLALQNGDEVTADLLGRLVGALAGYKGLLAASHRSWPNPDVPPAGGGCGADAWQAAAVIFLASDTNPDEAVANLKNLANTIPDFAITVARGLGSWVRRVCEGSHLQAVTTHSSQSQPEVEAPPTELQRMGMSWQEVAERLERLRSQGEAFTSQGRLAKQLGCSSGTVNKAIRHTQSLQTWAKRPDPAGRPQRLTGVVADAAESRELSPEDDARIREYLEREDLTPNDRAYFNSLPDAEAQLKYIDDLEALTAKQADDDRRSTIYSDR